MALPGPRGVGPAARVATGPGVARRPQPNGTVNTPTTVVTVCLRTVPVQQRGHWTDDTGTRSRRWN